MEFITKLKTRKGYDQLELLGLMEKKETPRMFDGIKFGDEVHLSIQASFHHYCSPRVTIDPQNYNAMELAVFVNNEWTNLEDSEIFNEFPLIEEFKDCNTTNGLYGYLSVRYIEDLYQYLKRKFGEDK